LKALRGKRVRPTTDRVREAWMSALGEQLVAAHVWDLFSGSGALGLEALSRGASRVSLVEHSRGALDVIRRNVEMLGAEDDCVIVADDVFRFLGRSSERAGIALADPPYGTEDARRIVELFLSEPFANELWLEHPWRETLPLPSHARTRRYGDTALTTLTTD
jgi:16S rRNA (guanine966-N2)-methyltransferase